MTGGVCERALGKGHFGRNVVIVLGGAFYWRRVLVLRKVGSVRLAKNICTLGGKYRAITAWLLSFFSLVYSTEKSIPQLYGLKKKCISVALAPVGGVTVNVTFFITIYPVCVVRFENLLVGCWCAHINPFIWRLYDSPLVQRCMTNVLYQMVWLKALLLVARAIFAFITGRFCDDQGV